MGCIFFLVRISLDGEEIEQRTYIFFFGRVDSVVHGIFIQLLA